MSAREPVALVELQHRAREAVRRDRPPGLDPGEALPQHGGRAGGPLGAGMKSPDLRLLGAAEDGADAVSDDQRRAIAHRSGDGILGRARDQAGERDKDGLHASLGGERSQCRAAWKGSGSRPANGLWPGGHVSRGFS